MTEAISTFSSLNLVHDPDLNTKTAEILLGLEYWRDIRGSCVMPSPDDLDAIQIPNSVLPHISLLDIEYLPEKRFHWRLIGTAITSALSRDMTGQYWDEIYSEDILAAWLHTVDVVMRSRRPLRFTAKAHVVGKEIFDAEHIYMPMSRDDDRIDRLLTISIFTNSNGVIWRPFT